MVFLARARECAYACVRRTAIVRFVPCPRAQRETCIEHKIEPPLPPPPAPRVNLRFISHQALGSKVKAALETGAADATTIAQLRGKLRASEAALKLARCEVKNLEGLGEMDRAEIEGLREDLAVHAAGWDAECKEKEEVRAEAEQRTKVGSGGRCGRGRGLEWGGGGRVWCSRGSGRESE